MWGRGQTGLHHQVRAILEAELTAASVPHDIKVYPGTKHAFFNDELSKTYGAVAAADSWERVIAFFDEHVKGRSVTA